MPSPFPGMDPYLEEADLWQDVHGSLIFRMRAELNARLPERYVARADRYVWLQEPDTDSRRRLGKPDVFLTEGQGAPTPAQGGVATAAPISATLPLIPREGNRYLRIVDRHTRRVVTVIELLSPSNKDPGEDRELYLAKRNEYLATGTNLVEIDLLRAGGHLDVGAPPPPAGNYCIMVSRAVEYPRVGLWSFSVREPLPDILVPLLPEDAAVSLPLKICFDLAYDEGRYGREVNYHEPPVPPLPEPDATWARELLAASPRSRTNPT